MGEDKRQKTQEFIEKRELYYAKSPWLGKPIEKVRQWLDKPNRRHFLQKAGPAYIVAWALLFGNIIALAVAATLLFGFVSLMPGLVGYVGITADNLYMALFLIQSVLLLVIDVVLVAFLHKRENFWGYFEFTVNVIVTISSIISLVFTYAKYMAPAVDFSEAQSYIYTTFAALFIISLFSRIFVFTHKLVRDNTPKPVLVAVETETVTATATENEGRA